MEDLYCKIFVETRHDRPWLLETIASILGGEHDRWTVHSEFCDVTAVVNDDADSTRFSKSEDGFLFSSYYLDIDAPRGSRAQYVGTIGTLLLGLWDAGCAAVAACDFEEELPESGGIGRSNSGLRP
jgi:hypothetical protein